MTVVNPRKLLWHRIARLLRLVELGAPNSVLEKEVQLIEQAAKKARDE